MSFCVSNGKKTLAVMYGRRSRFEMREERVSLHRRQAVALARPQQGKPGQKQAGDNGQLNSNPVLLFFLPLPFYQFYLFTRGHPLLNL